MAESRVSVIVVGAGFAGLTAAIESKRRGLDVLLIEKYLNSNQYGDIIDFFPNACRIMENWGDVVDRLSEVCVMHCKYFDFRRYDGMPLLKDPWFLKPEHVRSQFGGHRGEMWQILKDYATSIGVKSHFGMGVVQYLEEEDRAGVRLADGSEKWADCVVASDGPRSLARSQVLKLKNDSVNSGHAIYRAYYDVTPELREHPLIKEVLRKDEDICRVWLGETAHMLLYVWKKATSIAWVLSHEDDHDIGESWSFPGKIDEALAYIPNNDPLCAEVVRHTPTNQLIDYKLVWRPEVKRWISEGGRTILIGDAAHCHLPDSGQGGSQAMEDGIVVAVCLEAAKLDVKLALQVAERVRYNRSHVIHQAGLTNRDAWDAGSNAKDGEKPEQKLGKRPDWVIEFDPEANAKEWYPKIVNDIRNGRTGTMEELSVPTQEYDYLPEWKSEKAAIYEALEKAEAKAIKI